MRFKESINLMDVVEHLDKIIDHDETEKPVVRIFNGIYEMRSHNKGVFEYGEEKILVELKKYLDLIKEKEREEISNIKYSRVSRKVCK